MRSVTPKCKCYGCDYDHQEKIPFATICCSYTHRFAKYVVERNAYGFRDEEYFKLKLHALHDCRITRNLG